MCIIMTYLHCCMAETNTTLLSHFPPLKKKSVKTSGLWNGERRGRQVVR